MKNLIILMILFSSLIILNCKNKKYPIEINANNVSYVRFIVVKYSNNTIKNMKQDDPVEIDTTLDHTIKSKDSIDHIINFINDSEHEIVKVMTTNEIRLDDRVLKIDNDFKFLKVNGKVYRISDSFNKYLTSIYDGNRIDNLSQ